MATKRWKDGGAARSISPSETSHSSATEKLRAEKERVPEGGENKETVLILAGKDLARQGKNRDSALFFSMKRGWRELPQTAFDL